MTTIIVLNGTSSSGKTTLSKALWDIMDDEPYFRFGSDMFENLKDGASVDQFLEWFPSVKRQQIETVLEHSMKTLMSPHKS